ncbi:hypothetical protein EJ05DRAFT_474161 [Pseudovirgaria hyperparasitica]|uniref:CENP-V/GFA domain-containing protein n=1 Tax=Pseudovirgaria hyperparasitica TaxID=470096 RepID=A0A6A6WBP1_9PEZI|nr:uncharacterized protein EJ05DRAFT_474161 [Pseudovirgaria hyperparasitica]KAF2760268.1 hypothetical protein EJ05DRAFT_474161 [Pseudovirgaria hyperparasitica]
MAPKKLDTPPSEVPVSRFENELTGSCLCGSISVSIQDKELFVGKKRGHLCHCANCRKVAGSHVASNLLIEEEKVKIEDKNGIFKCYLDGETLSGNKLERWFCGQCGNPIKSVSPLYPGKVILKMGIFPRIPEPEAEAYSVNRQVWEGRNKDVKMYATKNFGDVYTGDL